MCSFKKLFCWHRVDRLLPYWLGRTQQIERIDLKLWNTIGYISALWFEITMNRDGSTGSLARPFTRSCTPLIHLLVLPCSLCSFAHSLTSSWGKWMIRCLKIRLFWTMVNQNEYFQTTPLWSRIIKSPNCSTGPLARPFARIAHLFVYSALLASLPRSAALTCSLARSAALTHSLACGEKAFRREGDTLEDHTTCLMIFPGQWESEL